MDTIRCPHCGRELDLIEFEAGEALIIRGVAKMPVRDRKPFLTGMLALYTLLLIVITVGVWRRPSSPRPPEASRSDWRE